MALPLVSIGNNNAASDAITDMTKNKMMVAVML